MEGSSASGAGPRRDRLLPTSADRKSCCVACGGFFIRRRPTAKVNIPGVLVPRRAQIDAPLVPQVRLSTVNNCLAKYRSFTHVRAYSGRRTRYLRSRPGGAQHAGDRHRLPRLHAPIFSSDSRTGCGWPGKWLARLVSHLGRWLTGIEIHPVRPSGDVSSSTTVWAW